MEHPTPQTIAGVRHRMIDWYREKAPYIWPKQHLGGSQFVAPPCLPAITATAAGVELDPLSGTALQFADAATNRQFARLAEYYAAAMEEAKTYYVGPDLSHLALRTEMPQYRLTLDMLPSPSGFLVWALPVGSAEHFFPRTSVVDAYGNITENTNPVEIPFNPFEDTDNPVIGASWRYEETDNSVWVVFYALGNSVLAQLSEVMLPHEVEAFKEEQAPIAFEREQHLPLDRTLEWFDAPEGDRLRLTAHSAVDSLPEHLKEFGRQRDQEVLPSLTQMVRSLVATFMLMKWKIVNREEIAPPPYVAREIAQRTGQTKGEVKAANRTVFVKLGQPLKHRNPAKGSKAGQWTVRVIVGPVIRTRQYIPATGEFDYTPRLIAPYIAGPADAPIKNVDKVFLLK